VTTQRNQEETMLHLRTMNETRAYAPASWMRRATAAGILGLALTSPVALAQPDTYVNHASDNGTQVAPQNWRSPDAEDAATKVNSTDARHAALVKTGSLAGSTGSNQAPASEPVNRVKADDGLDWGSAGIGAGAVTAAMLLGLAGTIGMRRSRVHPAN
jgi:hypothetical protein